MGKSMKRILFSGWLALALGCVTTGAYGQTSVGITPDMRADANSFYQAGDWGKAADAYFKIVNLEPSNINASYRYGMSLLNQNMNERARASLANAFGTAPNPIYALALARVYARLDMKKEMFEVLEKSTTIGGIAPETLTSEKDFASVQNEPQFKELVKKSDIVVNPCKAKNEFRQFDFWIGDWDVKTPQGAPAGQSSIQLILGQCIILENWTGGSGTNGKSFNIYDTNDNKWHQTWVDDKGTFTHYIGGVIDGSMVVVADTLIGGKKTLAKMTFTKLANGDVRQHGENSTDDGKSWTTSFDLIYSRKK